MVTLYYLFLCHHVCCISPLSTSSVFTDGISWFSGIKVNFKNYLTIYMYDHYWAKHISMYELILPVIACIVNSNYISNLILKFLAPAKIRQTTFCETDEKLLDNNILNEEFEVTILWQIRICDSFLDLILLKITNNNFYSFPKTSWFKLYSFWQSQVEQ